MPPKSRAKRKAEKASRRSLEVRKQQQRSLQFADSIATAVVGLTSPVLSDQALEESSSSVTVSASASTEELPGPSGLST